MNMFAARLTHVIRYDMLFGLVERIVQERTKIIASFSHECFMNSKSVAVLEFQAQIMSCVHNCFQTGSSGLILNEFVVCFDYFWR